MKKLVLSLLFLAGTTVAMAQVDKVDDQQENIQDKIQQEPQLPAQLDMERNARIEAQRQENEKAAAKKARKLAKAQAKQAAVVRDSVKKRWIENLNIWNNVFPLSSIIYYLCLQAGSIYYPLIENFSFYRRLAGCLAVY